jgi:flagellar protein FliS
MNPAFDTLAYLRQQIANATPAQQLVMLFDGAIRYCGRAREAIEAGDIQERHNNNRRAMEIIGYLLDTLDPVKGGEAARRLQRIYLFLLRRMSDVDFSNDPRICEEVTGHLKTLRAGWEKMVAQETPKAAPVVSSLPRAGDASEAVPVRRNAVA